jgi:hypothetical protein
MDIHTYEKIYSALDSSNIKSISGDFDVDEDVLTCILNQKMVRSNKKLYHRVVNEADALLKRWVGGESFMSLSDEMGLSPVLMSIILLKQRGTTRKGVQQMLRNPDIVDDERLRKELSEVVENDNLFSPHAHSLQVRRARRGEELIENWLLEKDIDFLTENEIKKHGDKTPDFLLKKPLNIDNTDISWIDSKGLFGDEEEHRRLLKKQFLEYIEFFGGGMVVYWCGFVDSIAEDNSSVLIKDNTYFGVDNTFERSYQTIERSDKNARDL